MNPWGIGIDIIEISRVKEAYVRCPRILNRLFTGPELQDYRDRGSRTETLAGKFAAKEAIVKAMGTGLRGFAWIDIEILPDEFGKPFCRLYGKAAEKSEGLKISGFLISISHNRTVAIANAMALKKEDSREACNQ